MHKYLKVFLAFALALAGSVMLFNLFNGDDNSEQDFTRSERRQARRLMPPAHGEFSLRAFERLNLTDAQKTRIENLQSDARQGNEATFEKIKNLDEQFQTLIGAGAFDEAAARQILNEKSQAEIEMQLSSLKTEAAVKSVLTDDQKVQLDELRKPRRGKPRRPMPPQENE